MRKAWCNVSPALVWCSAAFIVLRFSTGVQADAEIQISASEPIILQHPPISRPGDNYAYCLAFVNNGAFLATGATTGVLIWDVAKRELRHSLTVGNRGVDTLALDPRSAFLVAGCASGQIKIWDTRTWKETRSLGAGTGAVRGLVISPDGKLLASASPDGQKGEKDQEFGIILWDLGTGQKLRTLPQKPPSLGTTLLTFTPDGKRLIAGQDSALHVWEVETGKEMKAVPLHGVIRSLGSMALRFDGRELATGVFEPRIRIWDTESWKQRIAWDAHSQEKPPRQGVSCVSYSPDGKLVLSGGMDGTVCAWQASTGRQLLQLKSEGGRWVTGVAMSPDGSQLAATNIQATATIWRLTRK